MRYTLSHRDTDLEIRVLEIEDTLKSISSILGTMTDLIGMINQVANHCADTVLGLDSSPTETSPSLWSFGCTCTPRECK
jgi:hypothetical protein